MLISHRPTARTVALLVFSLVPSLLFADLAAAAASGEDAPSVTVRYRDLDLNSPEGVASLYGRIRGAAGEVCRPLEGRELERKLIWSECFNHAVADAVHAVHNATLSAYHWQRIRGWKHHEIETPTAVASR